MEAWAKYAYFAIIVLAIPVWFAAAWNYIGMLRRVKGGNFLRLMFDIFWWMPDRAGRHLTVEGMIYYRRTVWLIVTFLTLVFVGIVLGFAMVLFQGR